MKKMLLWVIGVLVALAIIGALFGGDDKSKAPADQSKPATQQTNSPASSPAATNLKRTPMPPGKPPDRI